MEVLGSVADAVVTVLWCCSELLFVFAVFFFFFFMFSRFYDQDLNLLLILNLDFLDLRSGFKKLCFICVDLIRRMFLERVWFGFVSTRGFAGLSAFVLFRVVFLYHLCTDLLYHSSGFDFVVVWVRFMSPQSCTSFLF